MEKVELIEVWENVLKYIEKNVAPESFKTWFVETELVSIDKKNIITISVEDLFVLNHLEMKYAQIIQDALTNTSDIKGTLNFILKEEVKEKKVRLKKKPKKKGKFAKKMQEIMKQAEERKKLNK